MRIEERDRKLLHMPEHVVPDISKHIIGDDHHDLGIEDLDHDADQKQYPDFSDPGGKSRIVHRLRARDRSLLDQRRDIVIDQIFYKYIT